MTTSQLTADTNVTDRIKAMAEKSREEYRRMVIAASEGDLPAETKFRQVLAGSGKSVDDFERDLKHRNNRLAAVKQLVEAETLEKQTAKLNADREKAQEELTKTKERHKAELTEAQRQYANAESALALNMNGASDLRRQAESTLRGTAPRRLLTELADARQKKLDRTDFIITHARTDEERNAAAADVERLQAKCVELERQILDGDAMYID